MFLFSSCEFINSFTEKNEEIIELSFDKRKMSLAIGEMNVLNLTASKNQNGADIKWIYDETKISAVTDNYGAVITGLMPGNADITAVCGSNSVSCVVTVSEETYAVKVNNPYVYASKDYVFLKPAETVKVTASLFGSTVSDMNGFTWSIDNPSVASIVSEGNYCWITGAGEGQAKISVKHNKSAFGYSILLNCAADEKSLCYITTKKNIVTINLSENNSADLTLSLVNNLKPDIESSFSYSFVDSNGSIISENIAVTSSFLTDEGVNVTVQASEPCECFLRVSHPDALYDMDVLVRVIKNADVSFIDPSQTYVTVSDSYSENIDISIRNFDDVVNPELITWTFSENASDYIDFIIFNGSENTGDSISIRGKKNGCVKITVNYLNLPSRDIIVLIRNINSQAADASSYITTTQNYIRMYTDDSPKGISVYLINISQGEIDELEWKISNHAADGGGEVIKWKTGNGTHSSRSISLSNNAAAFCVIEPLKIGTAYIDISHPKAMYSTRITVDVVDKPQTVENTAYLNLVSSPVVKIKNGETKTIKVKTGGGADNYEIIWTCEGNENMNIFPSGNECAVKSPAAGSGLCFGYVTASCQNAYPATFRIITYDDEASISESNLKVIYSYATSHTVNEGRTVRLQLESSGLNSSDIITWSIEKGDENIILFTQDSNKTAVVEGIKSGNTVIKASCEGCSDVKFFIKIVPENILENTKSSLKLTSSPVIKIKNGEYCSVKVNYTGTGNSSYINWEAFGEVTVSGLGTECIITAPSSGSGIRQSSVTASYPGAYPVTFSVITYDDETEVNDLQIKSIYSYSTLKTVQTGSEVFFELETEGFDSKPEISWKIISGSENIILSTKNSDKTAVIEGVKSGETVIKASCEGCADVFFVVKIADAASFDMSAGWINICSSPVVTIKNGGDETIKVNLCGNAVSDSVEWSCEGNISLLPVGNQCVVKSPAFGSGIKQSSVVASYPGSYPVNFNVITYDDITLINDENSKCIYSYSTSSVVEIGSYARLTVENAGFKTEPDLKWDIISGEDCIILSTQDSNKTCVVEGVKSGSAVIKVSCSDCSPVLFYVKVIEKENSIPENFVFNLISSPNIELKNGTSELIEVKYVGSGDENLIQWSSTGPVSISGFGSKCTVTAPKTGFGGAKSTVTASYPGAYPVTFSVVTYDTSAQKQLNTFKNIYASSSIINSIYVDDTVELKISAEGFEMFNGPSVNWSIVFGEDNAGIYTKNSNKTCVVEGLNAGNAIIKASCDGCSDIVFLVKISKFGIIKPNEPCYLTTDTNVMYFDNEDDSKNITVGLVNMEESVFNDLNWEIIGNGFEVISNGNKASVICIDYESEALLKITHELSQNELYVNLKSGEQFEYKNNDVCLISVNQDIVELNVGQDDFCVIAALNHTEVSDNTNYEKNFSFKCESPEIAEISYVNLSDKCYVKPIKNGITKLIVSHPDAAFDKEVILIVYQNKNAVKLPYITTKTNVITVVQGEYAPASVSLENSSSCDVSKWRWKSKNSQIANVIANNGTTCMVSGNTPGVTQISVKHDDCSYPLDIIVVVLDKTVVNENPYIKTDSNIITLKKGSSTVLKASMIGGSDEDLNYFRFSSSNNYAILVNSSGETAYIKGLQSGTGYITVYNSRYPDSYSKTVLVVVEDIENDDVYISVTPNNIIKLSPDNKELTIIEASLVNGDVLDAENFIWWADDYNIVSITSIAGKCSIVPTGKTGFTKIHVSHHKALKTADILVSVTNYDKFSFPSSSKSISAEKLYFIPLEVPAVEEDYIIEYFSSNPEVCIIEGSKSVAWLCGVSYGMTSLRASILSTVDNSVLATTEMMVSVSETDPLKPVISLGDVIINEQAGNSRTFTAFISNVDESERYNLKWSIKNKTSGITIMNEDADKSFTGPDCYVTFESGGDYVLVCEHPKYGVSSEIYIKVEEKGELDIELSSNLEIVYKEDGSFTLSANIINGTASDYSNIEWSAVKVNGLSVVSVSKSKDKNCIVSPKNIGQTSVVARLPNGAKAVCIVIVKASVEISFDTTSVHVIPGYTQTVNYTTNPADVSINWYSQFTQSSSSFNELEEYFSFEDDPVKKQLHITGIKDYQNGSKNAGTIIAAATGANSANLPVLKVFVEYNQELRLSHHDSGNFLTQLHNNKPDTDNVSVFDIIYSPTDMDIDLYCDNSIFACIGNTSLHKKQEDETSGIKIGNIQKSLFVENGTEKAKISVAFIPTTECTKNITVVASIPSDTNGQYAVKKSFSYTAYYEKYDIELVPLQDMNDAEAGPIKDSMKNAFTSFVNTEGKLTTINLSDGEEAVFYLKITNENAAGQIQSLKWAPNLQNFNNKDSEFNESPDLKDRKSRASTYFGVYNPIDVAKNNKSPTKGLIYITKDSNSIPNTTIYRLGHAWDYYKDIPDFSSIDSKTTSWKDFFKAYNFDPKFFQKLSDVDWWVVNREVFYKGKTAFKHKNMEQLSSTWIMGNNYRDGNMFSTYIQSQWLKHTLESKIRLQWRNTNLTDKTKDFALDEGYFRACLPFVVSKDELQNNKTVVRPDTADLLVPSGGGYDDDNANRLLYKYSDNYWDDGSASYCQISKLLIPSYEYIAPTICKDTTSKQIGAGTLDVQYTDGKGTLHTQEYRINVNIFKRDCEAYTNGKWKTENLLDENTQKNVTHYVLGDSVFDYSVVQDPFLIVDKQQMELSRFSNSPESLSIPYEIFPKDSVLTITLEGQWEKAPLTIKNADSITKNADSVTYSFSSHLSDSYFSDVGIGNIEFEVVNYDLLNGDDISSVSADKKFDIKIESSTGVECNVPCTIKPSDFFVPVGGTVEQKLKKMIVIKDGQSADFVLKNLNQQSSSQKELYSVNFFSAKTIAEASSDFTRSLQSNFGITSYDDECEKVVVKISENDYCDCNDDDCPGHYINADINVNVRHTTDYGVKWKSKPYGHPDGVLNLYKDSQARFKAASSYADKISVIKDVMNTPRYNLGSSTIGLHYENCRLIKSPESYQYAFVGVILLTFGDDYSHDYHDYIPVFVDVCEVSDEPPDCCKNVICTDYDDYFYSDEDYEPHTHFNL